MFGISDHKVRERLLRESALTLKKTDEICRVSESSSAQMREVGQTDTVSVINTAKKAGRQRNATSKQGKACGNCGRHHEIGNCAARGKLCNECGKLNHFASVCRSGKRRTGAQKDVKTVEELAEFDESDGEIYVIGEISAVTLDDSQLVTVKLESGNCLRFQQDTGAQCNVIPLELYKKATNDTELKGVKQAKTAIAAYGGSRLPVVGQVIIPVWRKGQRFKLDCKLVDNIDIRPILGRKACLGMNIIQYMDNDEIHKPEVGNAPVYTMTSASSSGLNRADLIRQFPRVFAEEVGQLEGEYHIKLDAAISPVQHAPQQVLVALRDQLKAELDKMTEQGIVAPVTAPTPWVSSLVVVPKKNGMLRLCLDPKDLNKAVQREHYPLPTIEDVATRLHGAKVFTKLNVRSGFWHITLDNASSYLTTFNTPFGRFRWRRMPFGIRSAPEVFQRRMHELIEGMPQVEVIADDFVVVGKSDTIEEANSDHDKNLVAFLRLCDEKGLKLNAEKLKLRQPEVSFIGHIATGEGLKVDPAKVKAIREMPAPTDKAGSSMTT